MGGVFVEMGPLYSFNKAKHCISATIKPKIDFRHSNCCCWSDSSENMLIYKISFKLRVVAACCLCNKHKQQQSLMFCYYFWIKLNKSDDMVERMIYILKFELRLINFIWIENFVMFFCKGGTISMEMGGVFPWKWVPFTLSIIKNTVSQ